MPQSSFKELPFKLNVGMDSYDTGIAEQTLKLQELKNLYPKDNRLFTQRKQKLFQTITDNDPRRIVSFAYYVLDDQPVISLYALGMDHLYQWNTEDQTFNLMTATGGGTYTNDIRTYDPFASMQWEGVVYVTRLRQEILKLQNNIVYDNIDTTVAADTHNLTARYMINAAGHMMLGYTNEGDLNQAVKIRWSDLNAPEDFRSTSLLGGESDSFEFPAENGFISGLTSQRGFTNVYLFNSIWRGRYTPGRTISGVLAPFTFDELFPGLGAVYHYSVAQVKDVDYFIGQDNVYKLDGLNPVEIGDEIWNFFESSHNNLAFGDSVYAHVNERDNEISWLYATNIVGKTYWSIVYNYKEQKWSNRDPQNMFSAFRPSITLKSFYVIDDFDFATYGGIDTFDGESPAGGGETTTYIDGDWQFKILPFRGIFGGELTADIEHGTIYEDVEEFAMFDDTAMACEFETYEFDVNSFFGTKEIDAMKLLIKKSGSPNITLNVSTRPNQDTAFTTSIDIDSSAQLAGATEFYFSNFGVDNFMKFKVSWNNTDANYIEEVYGIAFKVRTPIEDVEQVKQ